MSIGPIIAPFFSRAARGTVHGRRAADPDGYGAIDGFAETLRLVERDACRRRGAVRRRGGRRVHTFKTKGITSFKTV